MSVTLSDLDRKAVEMLTSLSIYCELLVVQKDTEVATKAYNLIWAQRSDYFSLLNRNWRHCPADEMKTAVKAFRDGMNVATSASIFPVSLMNETLVGGLKAIVQALSNPPPRS